MECALEFQPDARHSQSRNILAFWSPPNANLLSHQVSRPSRHHFPSKRSLCNVTATPGLRPGLDPGADRLSHSVARGDQVLGILGLIHEHYCSCQMLPAPPSPGSWLPRLGMTQERNGALEVWRLVNANRLRIAPSPIKAIFLTTEEQAISAADHQSTFEKD